MSVEWVANQLESVRAQAEHAVNAVTQAVGLEDAVRVYMLAFRDAQPGAGVVGPDWPDEPGNLVNPAVSAGLDGDPLSLEWVGRLEEAREAPDDSMYELRLRGLLLPILEERIGSHMEVWLSWAHIFVDDERQHYAAFAAVSVNKSAVSRWTRDRRADERLIYHERMTYLDSLMASLLVAVNGGMRIHAPSPRDATSLVDLAGVRVSAATQLLRLVQRDTIRWGSGSRFARSRFAEICNVAAARHEGSEASGRLLFADSAPQLALPLVDRAHLHETRRVRRLVEATHDSQAVIIQPVNEIVGFAPFNPGPNDYWVRFRSRSTWELLRGTFRLMTTRDGRPLLPRDEVDESALGALTAMFDAEEGVGLAREITQGIADVIEIGRGTVLVVTAGAQEEAERLRSRCVRITPVRVTAGLLVQFAAVDGATLIGTDGCIYAFGSILDGVVGDGEGDPARGSRFNSTQTYVRGRAEDHEVIAIIVSEDGDVTPVGT